MCKNLTTYSLLHEGEIVEVVCTPPVYTRADEVFGYEEKGRQDGEHGEKDSDVHHSLCGEEPEQMRIFSNE